MTPITLVITRKEHGGMEIIPREWDEKTDKLNVPIDLKQHDRIEIFQPHLPAKTNGNGKPKKPDSVQLTMRKHMTATNYDGASLYTQDD